MLNVVHPRAGSMIRQFKSSRLISSTEVSHTARIWPDNLGSQSSLATFMSTKLEPIIILVLWVHFTGSSAAPTCIRCKDEDVEKTAQYRECSDCPGSPWMDRSVPLANSGPVTGFHWVFPQHIFQHAVFLAWVQHHIATHRPLMHAGTLRKAVKSSHRQHTPYSCYSTVLQLQ